MLIRQWMNEIEGVAAVPRVSGRHRRETGQICGFRIEHAQAAGVDRIASWGKRLVDGLIKRAVMEGILRHGPEAF